MDILQSVQCDVKAVECKERGKKCQSDRLTRSDSGIEVTLGLSL